MLSDKVTISKSNKIVFDYLCSFDNYKVLMPEQVVDWSSDEQQGIFTIKGMATIGLKIVEKNEATLVRLEKTKAPFDLNLHCNISSVDADNCILQLNLNADLNPMLKMLAEKPLTNFINTLAHNCKKICETV